MTIKAGGSSYASIAILHGIFCKYCNIIPAKIPHFFENFQILAFYAILFTTSLIVR
jgi:hypothetical protein